MIDFYLFSNIFNLIIIILYFHTVHNLGFSAMHGRVPCDAALLTLLYHDDPLRQGEPTDSARSEEARLGLPEIDRGLVGLVPTTP